MRPWWVKDKGDMAIDPEYTELVSQLTEAIKLLLEKHGYLTDKTLRKGLGPRFAHAEPYYLRDAISALVFQNVATVPYDGVVKSKENLPME